MPYLEDLGVTSQPVDVGLERPNLRGRLECVAQEIAERRQQPASQQRLVDGKGGDGVERVEQKVGL